MRFYRQGVSAGFADGILSLQSGGLERKIDFSAGAPRTLEISLNGVKLAGRGETFDTGFAGLEVAAPPRIPEDVPAVRRTEALPAPAYDGNAVYVEIETFETARQITRIYRYILYPGLPMTGVELEFESAVTPLHQLPPRLAAEYLAKGEPRPATVLDTVTPTEIPADVRAVEFRMRTDYGNEPVAYHAPDADGSCVGNILEWRSGETGMVFFQEAPPANERQDDIAYDFQICSGAVKNCGAGFPARDVMPDRRYVTHRSWFGAADDTARLVRRFYLARIPETFRERYAVTANPWGSRTFYDRVGERFLLDEIAAAAKCGADIYQVDDGYQAGGVLGDLLLYDRPAGRDFWRPHPEKLPRGFAPLAEAARAAGVKLSLWFAAGMNRAYTDHAESAAILLDHFRRYGIDTFKLDGVIFSSHMAETNFAALLKTLFLESGGRIMANLDVTNGVRGGVGYLTGFGTLFLENRYVCASWSPSICYHPVRTLRNLWLLSRYVPTRILQIEAASIAEILDEVYVREEGRPPRPDEYEFKFWLGVTLFASPLLWFQPSVQPPEVIADAAEVMAIHRKYRKEIFSAPIAPAGGEPGKGELTGFVAESGFAIVYRTLEAAETGRVAPEHRHAELLYATGPASLAPDGTAALEKPGTFALWRIG